MANCGDDNVTNTSQQLLQISTPPEECLEYQQWCVLVMLTRIECVWTRCRCQKKWRVNNYCEGEVSNACTLDLAPASSYKPSGRNHSLGNAQLCWSSLNISTHWTLTGSFKWIEASERRSNMSLIFLMTWRERREVSLLQQQYVIIDWRCRLAGMTLIKDFISEKRF